MTGILAPGALTGLADGLTQVVVSAADGAGNPAQVTAGVEILQSDPVSAAFDTTLFGDNIINISEAGSVQLVTGTSTVVPGQTLSVTVTGADRPGVTGTLLGALSGVDAEVLDIQQVAVHGHLTLTVLLRPGSHVDQLRDAAAVAARVRNAGAVFVGTWAPVSLGDYCAGSNHVLPTGGCATHSSGLSVQSFLRGIHVVEYDEAALREVGAHVVALARAEDLPGLEIFEGD